MEIPKERYDDLVNLARAFASYLEDDSRSRRRRFACLHKAKSVLATEEASED